MNKKDLKELDEEILQDLKMLSVGDVIPNFVFDKIVSRISLEIKQDKNVDVWIIVNEYLDYIHVDKEEFANYISDFPRITSELKSKMHEFGYCSNIPKDVESFY